MKSFAAFATVLCFAASGSVLAAPVSPNTASTSNTTNKNVPEMQKHVRAPVQMSEAQMDQITGGALVEANFGDVGNKNNIAVPVNAAVGAGILGNGTAVALQGPVRQNQ
jgi:hypothetical protein